MDELPQNISSKMFCWSSISKRDKIGSKRFMWMCQSPTLPYLHSSSVVTCCKTCISLQYKLFRTRSRPMDTQSAFFLFLKENVCSGYSLEAALSNLNDSFTLSRLMKRPKTCCHPAQSRLEAFCGYIAT